MGCGDRSVAFFNEHLSSSERALSKRKGSMIKCREVEHAVKSEAPLPTPSWQKAVTETLMNCQMWITLSQTRILVQFDAQLCIFEGNEAVIKKIKMAAVLR